MPFQVLRSYFVSAIAAGCCLAPPWLGGQPGNAVAFGPEAGQQSRHRFVLDGQGLLLASSDRATRMRVHGYLQGDGRLFATDLEDSSHQVFLFRRVRPLVEGTAGGWMAYRFMPDFGQGNTVIQEVYAETTRSSRAEVRLGKFKAPIGLEVLRSDRALTFPERSLVSDLVPLRDLGGQLEGSFLREDATYETGFFSGTQDGQNAVFAWSGSNDAVGRLFLQPLAMAGASHLGQLGVGLAGSAGHDHNVLPSLKTVGQQTFFKYRSSAYAEGFHQRLLPQASYYHGPLGIMAEYATSIEPAHTTGTSRELRNQAWEIQASYFLSGEANEYGIFEPPHRFNPEHPFHEHGSWEIALRYSEARMDERAFPTYADPAKSAQDARELGGGLSWYLNRVAKLMAYYEYTGFVAGAPVIKTLEPERVIMTRLQLAF